jgi:serine/threonine-protein kinase
MLKTTRSRPVTLQISCPEASELRELLDGILVEPRKSEMSGHLESCADCQRRLESLVAGRESWTGVASQLQQEESAASPALKQAVAELAQSATRTATTDTPPASDDQSLDFLDPPREPGHLGRLSHYEILEVIGRGGMGIVLKAFDEALHRVVAVKVMAPQLATSATARQRFIREVQAAAAVRDEHVVAIHAVDEDKGLPFFVMEYIGGQSLQERLDRSGPLEIKEILRIGMQAARGLAAAHAQGLIHRDVKPANILLENGVQRVKITDFGLARAADDASLTQSGVVAGTPQYMAPEQAESRTLDHRADLFSLGSVLYTICTGRAPFRASSPMAVLKRVCDDTPRPVQEVNADIPDWLAGIVVRLHAKDPARRYQSASEVADVLSKHLAHNQQPDLPPRQPPAKRSHWGRRLAAAAAMLGVIALSVYFFGPTLTHFLKQHGTAVTGRADKSGQWDPLSNVAKSFGPDDIIITQENVKQEDGGWRIENNEEIVGANAKHVRLYELRGPFPNDGELLFRAKMKTKAGMKVNEKVVDAITAGLYMLFRSETLAVGTTDWANYEVRYPLYLLHQSETPAVIPLNLCLWGRGTVWIKDIEVSYVGANQPAKPELRPGEELVKAFGPEDVPITKAITRENSVTFEPGYQEREGWWFGSAEFFGPIRLYELRNPELQGCELILRTKIKTVLPIQGIYPKVSCDTKDGGGIDSPKPDVIPKSNTNWTTYETRLEIPQGLKPALIRINLESVQNLQHQIFPLERAGFKDMVLVKAPLRSSAKDTARAPVKLKSFMPGTDTPLDKPDKVEVNAWRFDHSRANTRLFELREGLPEGGEFIYRAKLKTRTDRADFIVALMLGDDFPATFKSAEVVEPQVKGQKPEWSEYEARYPVHGLIAADPTTIRMNLRLLGAGTVWIKDIELWHVPPEPPLRRPGEVLFKRFGPRDKPISNDYRIYPTDGWQYEVKTPDRLIRLYELQNPEVQNCRLVFRARMQTIGALPSRLKIICRLPRATPREYVCETTVEGDTQWTNYEVSLPLQPGEKPDVIELAVQAKGRIVDHRYQFAIKDIELLKAPLKP